MDNGITKVNLKVQHVNRKLVDRGGGPYMERQRLTQHRAVKSATHPNEVNTID